MSMYKVVIIAWFFQVCLSKNIVNLRGHSNVHTNRKTAGFLLSMPKTLVSGENETICLSLHEATLPAKISIDLKWRERHYTSLRNIELDATCFEIQIPLKQITEAQFISVKVQVETNYGEIYSAHNQDPIVIYPNQQNKLLIEMDRGVYKPGDTVKFIILRLNKNFLPLSKKINDVRIKNPMDITVMVWQDITPDRGIISLDYQMVPEAMIGKWKLLVDNQTKQFEVAKYDIPRFKIDLRYPKITYYKTDTMDIYVCGKYSYNEPVAGLAFIKMSHSLSDIITINKLSEMKNGCSKFTFDKDELILDKIQDKTHDTNIYIHITATITEFGTNKMNVATGRTKIVFRGYNMKFHNNPMFLPGIPYQGQLKLTNNITDVDGEIIEICYNLAIKKSWNYFNNEQCQNFTIEEHGIIRFMLWPFKNNVLHVHLHARSINNSLITDNFLLVRLFSPTSSYIQLEKAISADTVCNVQYRYQVSYSSDNFYDGETNIFYYTVKSSTEIIQIGKYVHTVRKNASHLIQDENIMYLGDVHKYVKRSTSIDQFYLTFKINKQFISKYQILVYYVTKDGETVAITKSEEIEPCSLKVNSYWSHNPVLPDALATLNIKSESPALCTVSATDKRSKFIAANNHQTSLETVLKIFSPDRESARSGRNSCILANRKNQSPLSMPNIESNPDRPQVLRRSKRHVYSFSEDYDAYDIFSKFGTVTITNLQVVTKPCYSGPLVNDSYQVQFLTDHYESAHEETQVTIRSFFPENWLWELVPVTNSVQLQRSVPHSITSWITNVFCVSETNGIGFAEEIELTSFKPFFIEVLTPQSIKKGEHFNLLVHVFNYANYTFPIRISIRISDNLRLIQKMSATYCLKPNGTQTHNYPIIAMDIGTANVTVLAETDGQYQLPCGPETIDSKRDVVYKSFKVEPEGYFMTNTKSVLLCASNTIFENNITWNLYIPKDIVSGTDQVAATINADLLGQTIENLHQLLTIPMGCGEQIMASMAPNIYVLRYLNATDGLTSSIRQRIIRNLKMGYQRILNYAHPDGSFSPFGYYDPSGSMFLTAFVVKILQKAKEVIYVDQRVIDRAVNWIIIHQLENGCFDTMYHVFQDMGGTNMENSTAGLTGYVIHSLFDAKVNVPSTVQTNAKFCIRSQHYPDKYSMVISSNALFKMHWVSEARRFLEKAIAVSNVENNLMWWSTKGNDETYASDIEITSYALLALMEERTAENMARAHAVVQWLMSKMGPSGGFKSTQDTIVALDALTKYAEYMHSYLPDLNINLEAFQETHIFAIRENDRLKSKQVILEGKDGQVKVFLTGIGCALTQLTVSYFTINIPESEAFSLAVEVSPVSNIDTCSIKSISPCVTYEGPDKLSNMAVMEIALPSGFKADRSSLYQLVEPGNDRNIKMFEEKENQIDFYFTNLGKSQVCFSFNINENLPVENRKESLIKLYDYYRPEQNILQFYKILNNCSRSTIEGLQEQSESDSKPEAYLYNDQSTRNSGLNVSLAIPNEDELQQLTLELPSIEDSSDSETNNTCIYLRQNRTEAVGNVFTYKRDISEADSNVLKNSNLEMPKCVHVSINKNRVKRDANNKKNVSTENSTLNNEFVDIPVEPDTPNCVNIPFYAVYANNPLPFRSKRHLTWLRYKRDSSQNLNKDFVDIDIDMQRLLDIATDSHVFGLCVQKCFFLRLTIQNTKILL